MLFRSTSSSYARWGMPSKHIFAVMYNGNICINMKNHFHPVYHLQFMNDIDSNQFTAAADLTTVPRIIPNTSACWNWAQQASKENWDMIGLGGPAFTAIAYPTAKSLSQAPESTAEKTKKALNFLGPYINNSLAEREIFYIYYEGLLKRYNNSFINANLTITVRYNNSYIAYFSLLTVILGMQKGQ